MSRIERGVALGLGHEGAGLLPVVERGEDLVRLLPLEAPDVARVLGVVVAGARGVVAVEDRAAEGRALDAVAVGAEGVVPAREHPLERAARVGLAEDGDVVVLEAARVSLHLPLEPLVALVRAEALEDLLAEGLLLRGHVGDVGVDDLPVVVHLLPLGVVERKADQLLLLGRERR